MTDKPISEQARATTVLIDTVFDVEIPNSAYQAVLRIVDEALTAAREAGAAEARAEAACHVASYRQIADPKLVADRIKRGEI